MQPYSPLVEARRRAESLEHHDSLYEYIPGFRSHTMCNSDGPNASLALSGGMCMRWARNRNSELPCFLPSGYSLFIDYPLFIRYSHLCVVPHPAVMPYLFAIPHLCLCGAEKRPSHGPTLPLRYTAHIVAGPVFNDFLGDPCRLVQVAGNTFVT